MSLLHRNLVASAFQEMLKKFEPIAAEAAETVVAIVAPAAAPLVQAGAAIVEELTGVSSAGAPAGAVTSDHVAAGVAAAGAQPAASTPAVPSAPPPAAAAPVVLLSADKNTAALAAVDALGLQLANLATQLAAIRCNIAGG